ncbi:MAG: hypothetical protein E6423_02430 [Clostridium sp.]|uniref:DUF6873 family GME fold protein n=1 Tax=Clostridium TaxID=1485 RepID=UPI0018A03A1C|nr:MULTISPECIES: hypothetical protein [Clostridium]MDU4418423.1 hypothetical protein [Clostridium perfringens]MDB2119494.1 hypothetical protein [Clostridium paraputrificum]MDU1031500.1 hypothetical protein [Clostridium sp.]MDU2754075.1 hypothetical protein [Clostridium sp.]MDU2899804.1 hypothetical protein [Clostridium sp.]
MYCFLDYRISNEELNNIINLNIEPILIPKCSKVYEAINGHVDIQLNILDKKNKKVIVQKDISKDFLNLLSSKGIGYILSENSLGTNYPENIIINALITDNLFVHNLNYTDPNLLKLQDNKKVINVKQGYTKCSVLPLGKDAFITSDKGIYKKLIQEDLDVLLIPPGDILLPSLNYGFIGGVGGMISENRLALFGELNSYAYGKEVYNFLYKHDIEPIALKKGKLIDRGSLLCI